MDAPLGCWLSGWRKSFMAIAQGCYELYWTNLGGNISQNSSCAATFIPSPKHSKLDEQDMQDIAREVRTNLKAMYSCEPLHTDEQGLVNQFDPINNCFVLIQDIAWKTCRERWTIETSGLRRPGKSAPVGRHHDYDNNTKKKKY